MYPHEVQALMAKLIFFIFAVTLLCMGRISAAEVQVPELLDKSPQFYSTEYK
ncbi:MAG: hypothetical protein ACJAT2_003193 [Bacteriovoracaceae bacterium]|jgi:hypothetical protein